MPHILSNLPEEYQTILEIIQDKIDDEKYPLNIKRIRDNILVKFDQMNEQSGSKTSIEDKKPLYVKPQYKGTCATYGEYGQKSKDFWNKEGTNMSKFHYYDKPGYVKKYCLK